MFAERGLTTAQISALLLAWSLVAFALEVPTGALADRFSRRHVLAVAQGFKAAAFIVWWLAPSFTGYLVGFVLWGIESALTSGAFEARRYARVMGRAESVSIFGQVLGGLLAATIVGLGFTPLLIVSALVPLVAGATALSFPSAAPVERSAERSYLRHLREGVREAATRPQLRRLVMFSGAVFGLGAVDEYFGLLLHDAGIDNAGVGLWVAAFFVAAAAGSLVAYRLAGASRVRLAAVTSMSALALLATASTGGLGVPLALVVFNGLHAVQCVALDAQLQSRIRSGSRATVTSVQGLVSELFALAAFVVFGLMAGASSNQRATAFLALALLTAALAYAWAPTSARGGRRSRRP